jgi:hypothetical protein
VNMKIPCIFKVALVVILTLGLTGCGRMHNIYIGDTIGGSTVGVNVVNGATKIGISGRHNF